MSFHNQDGQRGQRGLNNGGEYNNDDAANQKEKQEQEFVSPSLCIPRTHANIRKERIFAVIRSLRLGFIGRIDIVEKVDEKTGTPFIRVFIHFTKWFQNAQTRQFLEHLETQKSANIVYDEPWFWKVTKSFGPAPKPHQQQQQQQQPSRFPKPRIDFDGGASTTRVQQEGQEQEKQEQQQVAATVSSKTPSSNASGTNAVSGKGKQVAKRMGYESGKGLGKKADGRLVPVQIKKNVGRNGIGLGSSDACAVAVAAVAADAVAADAVAVDAVAAVAADADAVDVATSSDYWTTHAHEGYIKCAFPKVLEQISVASAASAVEPRLSVSVSPPKLERRLFHDCCNDDDDDGVASVVYKMNMNKSNSA
jgi:hypothetical protein